MKNITSFENIDELTIKKLASEYNAIDGDKFTMELIRSPFPFGYSEIPDEIELMKIVYLKSEKDLDKEKTNKQNIDVEATLRNNFLYQFEYETTLKPKLDVKIIKIERLKDD
ncbi:MAG: hypothetical protein GW873_03730 [Nitrospirae bacterium]|nr:hypothetical protein [Nitrospirota bacterium]